MSNDETQPANQPVSGSRWEPGHEPVQQPVAPAPVAYAQAPARRDRGRLLLAGGAVGIALVAGAGGFALGHASADGGGVERFGRPGFGPNNGPDRMQGFPGGGPQQQQQPPGFQSGPGTQDGQDGFPGFGDRDGDGTPDNGADLPDGADGAPQGSSNS